MNAHLKSLTLFAGLLLVSTWTLQAARFAAPNAHLPLPLLLAPKAAPAAAHTTAVKSPDARQKLALDQRLSTVVRDPAQIKKADVQAVRSAFGADASKMLDLLRQAAD